MKKTKNIFAIIAMCGLLTLSACTGKDNSSTTTGTTDNSQTTTSTESLDEINAQLDDLYQQENQLFAEHKDAWDKAFLMMNKGNADPNGSYVDFLTSTVEANKDEFTAEEYETLQKDIEVISGIEDKIAELSKQLDSIDAANTGSETSGVTAFTNLTGKDFDGNDVDASLFSNNAVTVLNFWFTGCKPCVEELAKLNELNEEIKSMGGEVVGINTDAFDGNSDAIEEAKKILESQGAKYRNLALSADSDVGKYAANIMAFPTTILVDRNGNIIGEPMLGGVDEEANYNSLLEQIKAVVEADNK